MPKLTAPQSAQLTTAIKDSRLTGVVFTSPADGYRLSAAATYAHPDDGPAFALDITWADNGHGVLKLSESINGATVTAADTTPVHRIALNQLQRLLTMAIKFFRDHTSLAEADAAKLRCKARTTTHVTINVPTTNEARASTIEALNETAAAATSTEVTR